MLKLVLLSLFSLIIGKSTNFYNYSEIFGEDYQDALSYFKEHKQTVKSVLSANNIDERVVVSAIFPERIRFSIVKNFVETAALELLYLEYGSNCVDMSVGDFQIKPSFVEKLETQMEKILKIKKKYLYLFPKLNNEKAKRKFILDNLKQTEKQLQYISVFYDIINEKFNLKTMSVEEKIRFTASAYNTGFYKTYNQISENINSKFFPYGTRYSGTQYSYADISSDFYKKFYHTIF